MRLELPVADLHEVYVIFPFYTVTVSNWESQGIEGGLAGTPPILTQIPTTTSDIRRFRKKSSVSRQDKNLLSPWRSG